MKYLVSHQGQQVGPYELDEVVAKVRAKELDLFDYIFDQAKQDWVLLMEHNELAQMLKSNKPPRPPQVGTGTTEPQAAAPTVAPSQPMATAATSTSAHDITEWFVLKGENRFGPFAYHDVVRMLQQKVVFPFDLIWHAGLNEWQRLVEIPEFAPDHIRSLFTKSEKASDVFMQRKFKRTKYTGRVFVHDNLKLWKGESFEISRGGVGLSMKNALVVPGQQLNVHFTAQDDWPAFNAVCEVVSKKFVNDNSPIEYGLRFLSLSQDVQEKFYKKVA